MSFEQHVQERIDQLSVDEYNEAVEKEAQKQFKALKAATKNREGYIADPPAPAPERIAEDG